MKVIFDKVERGEVDEVIRLVRESAIDIKLLISEPKNFSQTPVFHACVNTDHETAFKMIKVLIELGIDPLKEDLLKQTPLFYAARQGNSRILDYLCNQCGDSVNRQDKYG
jgi:ankyrin repeat protein